MTKGGPASIKDTGFLTREAPAARWPLRNHSLLGRPHTRPPVLERFPCRPGKKADKTRRAQSRLGEGAAAGDWLSGSGWNLLRISTRWEQGQHQEPGPRGRASGCRAWSTT